MFFDKLFMVSEFYNRHVLDRYYAFLAYRVWITRLYRAVQPGGGFSQRRPQGEGSGTGEVR